VCIYVASIQKVPGRGHSLTIDSGWREVAEISLAFIRRHLPATESVAIPIGEVAVAEATG
jgi:hypothetical protein